MTIHPLYPQTAQQAPFDSTWAGTEVPTQEPAGLERVMVSEEKLYVVLAVVLIIWLGLFFFIYRTDRRLRKLERTIEQGIPEEKL